MDISTLTPEERAALKAALDQEPEDPIGKIAEVLQMICAEIDAVKEELAAVKKTVYDDMIGSIKSLYGENVRADKMAEFKGKYGSMLDPLAEPFGKVYGGNLHEKAFDFLAGMQGDEGYTDEVGDGKLKEVLQTIKDKLGLSEPAAVSVEVAKPAEPEAPAPEADDEMSSMDDEIARMKRREDKKPKKSDDMPARRRA